MMRCKKILLINNNQEEIDSLREALGKINCNHSLHVASKGSEALDMLMGSASTYNSVYSKGYKVQPDLILMNENLPDMSGLEFLSIMRRYYSLKSIKVYVTASKADRFDRAAVSRFGISGVVEKPFDFIKNTTPSVVELKAELVSEKYNAFLFLLPFINVKQNLQAWALQFLKFKSALTPVFGLKVAACAMTAIMIGAASSKSSEKTRVEPVASIQTSQSPVKAKIEQTEEPAAEQPVALPAEPAPLKKINKSGIIAQSPVAVVNEVPVLMPGIRVERDTTDNF